VHGLLTARIIAEAKGNVSENLIHHSHAQSLAATLGAKNSPLDQFARTGEISSAVTRDLDDAMRLVGEGGEHDELEKLQVYLKDRLNKGDVNAVPNWQGMVRAGTHQARMGQMGDLPADEIPYVEDAGHVASGAPKEISTSSVGNMDPDAGFKKQRNSVPEPGYREPDVPGVLQMRSKDRPAQEIKDRGKAHHGDAQRARATIVRRKVSENADRVDRAPLRLSWDRKSEPGRPEHHKLGQVLRTYHFREQITPTGWPTFHHDNIGEVVLNPESGGWGSTTGAHGRDERDLRAWLVSIGVQRG
jgi:hypothetical protein